MQHNNLRELLRAHIGLPCACCGKPMEHPTRDHIRPVRFGGSLTDDNKVVVCRSCHDDKDYLPLKDWLRRLRGENDPREPIVKVFRAARKAAEALLAA